MADSLICPACGARNKPKWEFCVRCGESLQGVTLSKATAPDFDEEEVPAAAPSAGLSWGLWAVVVVALGIAAVPAWRYARSSVSPDRPDPGAFTFPSRPSEPPAVVPTPAAEGPGAEDYEKGLRLAQEGKDVEAIPFLSRAVDAAPGNPRFRHAYAQALWATDARDQALVQYGEAARLAPGEYAYRLARIYEMVGRNAEAVRTYELVLGTNPGDPAIQQSLGSLLLKLNDFAKAAPHLEAAARARPTDLLVQQDLAYALEMSGNTARAGETYRLIIQRFPQAVIARDHLAELLDKEGRRGDAIALVQEGVKADPTSALMHRRLGSLLERAGRTQEAVAEYREYAKLAPNAADAKELADRATRLEASGS